jgi:hypothetical protein
VHSVGLASAPLYDAAERKFAGSLTMTALVHLIHHYSNSTTQDFSEVIREVDRLQIRELQAKVDDTWYGSLNTVGYIHPCASLLDAADKMLSTRSRRLPLVDSDEAGDHIIVGVLTQHRLLRFLAVNVRVEAVMDVRGRDEPVCSRSPPTLVPRD